MQCIDFSRAFLTFRLDLQVKPPKTVSHKPPFDENNARIQLDCHCRIVELATRREQVFVLGANCKTERVGVQENIWTEPNADFVPIVSQDRFLNIKTFDRIGKLVPLYPAGMGIQPDRQTGSTQEAFADLRIDVPMAHAERLETPSAIIEATLANEPLNARTQWETERYRVELEYPVKTMNVSRRHSIYQTDTGPILFPDLTRSFDDLIAGFELAFSALNCGSWTEFIVRAPTTLEHDIRVYHYSRAVRLTTRNEIWQRNTR